MMSDAKSSLDTHTMSPGTDAGISREMSLHEREFALNAREEVVRLREQGGPIDHLAEREIAMEARERAALSREEAAHLREEAAHAHEDALRAKLALEQLMVEMREVNAHLVEATLRAQSLTEEAEEANRSKDEFLATVSHELRTPLNAVLGWAQMLANKQAKGERAHHGAKTIQRNASILAHLIDDLLDVSRPSVGRLRLTFQPVDLVAVMTAAIDSVEMLAKAKKIKIFVASTGQARDPVTGDFGRLQQVVWNLLCNAIKFSTEDGRIDVSVTRTANHIEIIVSDAGEGIRPDFLPHVFDRFRQADSSTTRRHSGLGLGLSIAHQIVEQHNGTIRAESDGPGRGAMFTVCVPIVGPAAPDERRTAVQRSLADQRLQRLDHLDILVVEDNADVRELMATILEDVGAHVMTSGSVTEALNTLETRPPDVLISDIGLPDEDGFALIREIRHRESEHGGFLPALALTGFTRAEDRVRALAAGFQGFLAKPVEPAELTAAIAALARPSERNRH
jgi:signal transduction histidine kinase/ActR/RegA family two-component response regulator